MAIAPIFVSPIPQYLECIICHEVFAAPTRILCGHTFCSFCISSWIKKQSECPICRKKIKEKHNSPDLIAVYIINDLEVKCPGITCVWQGKFEFYKTHKTTCKMREPSSTESEIQELLKSTASVDEILNQQIEKGKSDEFILKFLEMVEKKPAKRPPNTVSTVKKKN